MPHADPKHRLLAQQLFGSSDGVGHRRRVAGAVRQKDAVRVHRQDVGGRGRGRHDRELASKAGQAAQDVVLDAKVERDHVEWLRVLVGDRFLRGRGKLPLGSRRALGPDVRLGARDLGDEVLPDDRERLRPRDQLVVRHGRVGADDGVEAARLAQAHRQRAGVDPRDPGDALPLEVLVEGLPGAVVAHGRGQVADDDAGEMDLAGFHVLCLVFCWKGGGGEVRFRGVGEAEEEKRRSFFFLLLELMLFAASESPLSVF